jgi:opacity protein-like surface antigen
MKNLWILVITIGAVALMSTGVSAETDIGFKGAGLELGIVNPEDVDATWGIGVFADLGTFMPQLGFSAYADYWGKNQDEFGTEFDFRDIAIGARTKWYFPIKNPKIQPYAGAGLGIHFLKAKVTIPDQNIGGTLVPGSTATATDEKIGLDIGGGMTAKLNDRADFVGEMWLGLVSDINQMSMKVGILYKLGQ